MVTEGPAGLNSQGEAVFDRAASLEVAGGDEQLLGEMADLFAAQCPKYMQDIRQSIASKDGAGLARAAHAFRGSVSNFHAQAAVLAGTQLETMGREGDLVGASAVCESLESILLRLVPALTNLDRGQSMATGSPDSSKQST
jgi:HPt (histidine-containing phosphotransfer) domain-containing protein